MDKIKKNKLLTALIVIFVLTALAVGLQILNGWDEQQGFFPSEDVNIGFQSDIEYNGEKFHLNEDIETVLVMGLDKYDSDENIESYNNDQQADFLMVFVLDKKYNTCSAIHINRDTMVDVNILGVAGQKIGSETKQIALSHTYGNGLQVSLRNTADSVSDLLGGIKIDHCVSTTMDSIAIINDLVGGVKVKVLDDFSSVDDSLNKGEMVTLKGEKALTYVRARRGLDKQDNERRMLRQRQYLEGLYKAVLTAVDNDEDFIVKTILKVSDYIVSNSHTAELQALCEKITSYKFLGFESIEGTSVAGEKHMEFYPDEEKLQKLIVEQFYKSES